MIYIIHETIAGDDPRWQPGMELIGDFWNYSVSTAPDGTFVDWLHGKVVGEFVAKSYKFVTARDGEIPVAKMTNTRNIVPKNSTKYLFMVVINNDYILL